MSTLSVAESCDLLSAMQAEQAVWARENFGDQPRHIAMLGIVEEIGEFVLAGAAAVDPASNPEVRDALGDITIYLSQLCTQEGINLGEAFRGALLLADSGGHPPKLIVTAGKMAHAFIKREQGIRGTREQHTAALATHVGLLLWNLEYAARGLGSAPKEAGGKPDLARPVLPRIAVDVWKGARNTFTCAYPE
jgi:NTP pyrophosphatase (non-canonical NTP hydrolase)